MHLYFDAEKQINQEKYQDEKPIDFKRAEFSRNSVIKNYIYYSEPVKIQ